MTEPDDTALDALRRLDRPHDLDAASLQRIEAAMLDRFDVVATADVTARPAGEFVELRRDDAPPSQRRAPRLALVAAAVIVLVGAIVFVRSGSTDVDVPVTQVPTPTTAPVDDGRAVDQLRDYCVEFVGPLVEASKLWDPSGLANERRSDVLVAVEQAAQGLVDLGPPAGAAFGDRDLALLDLATSARRADSLGPGADEAVAAARDALLAELAANPIAVDVPECGAG